MLRKNESRCLAKPCLPISSIIHAVNSDLTHVSERIGDLSHMVIQHLQGRFVLQIIINIFQAVEYKVL